MPITKKYRKFLGKNCKFNTTYNNLNKGTNHKKSVPKLTKPYSYKPEDRFKPSDYNYSNKNKSYLFYLIQFRQK